MPDAEVADRLLETVAALQRELAQCTAERDEALAQQIATADILAVISSSKAQLKPVSAGLTVAEKQSARRS
jgi:hypothetical protein